VPIKVAERILRFHLLDNTRGEPNMWRRDEVREHQLVLIVDEVTPAAVRLRLEGSALLASGPNVERAARGFDVRLLGHLRYDRTKQLLDEWDVVAVGDHWGEGTYTRRARAGRKPLGIVFELADGKSAADRVPPQGAREFHTYFGREP
jgi:hypothetical protein